MNLKCNFSDTIKNHLPLFDHLHFHHGLQEDIWNLAVQDVLCNLFSFVFWHIAEKAFSNVLLKSDGYGHQKTYKRY